MSIDKIIIYIMAVFAVLGAIDCITGNKLGIGKKFEEGIMTIGPLSLSMVGVIVISPFLADILRPAAVPVFEFFGADPSMLAGTILANDMGGAYLAEELAVSREAGLFSGLIVASMMGVTIVFTIPVALSATDKSDRKYFAIGVLSGIITIPAGAFAGGIIAGFSGYMVLKNLIPIALMAVLLAVGLWKIRDIMIAGFTVLARIITVLIYVGLILGILKFLTGFVVIKGLNPIEEGFAAVSGIAIMLSGAVPLMYVLTTVLKKPLMRAGRFMGINEISAAGLVATLANSIPMFQMVKNMDNRGKVINFAFAVPAAFVFGDHLGFTAGFEPTMIVPMIAAKLISGICAVILANFISNKMNI